MRPEGVHRDRPVPLRPPQIHLQEAHRVAGGPGEAGQFFSKDVRKRPQGPHVARRG